MKNDATTGTLSAGRFALLAVMFGLSGLTALVYQVAWQRILALHSGVGIYSVSMIVAAFLAGLGLGSFTGGKLSTRITPAASLRAFAVVEISIGLFALLSPVIYYDLLYMRFPGLYSNIGLASVVHFVSLIVPTFLMGMSLPFLVQAAVRETRSAFRDISYLYGINVVGAGLGALLAPWVLIRSFGIDGAVRLGAAGNILVGVTAFWIWRGLSSAVPPPDRAAATEPPPSRFDGEPERPFGLWLALYAVSGLIALSLEIVWFRVMDVGVKSNAFTFGSVLAIFLLGLAAGSLAGARRGQHFNRPLDGFLTCQAALLLYTGLSFVFLSRAPAGFPIFGWFVDYWAQADGIALGQEWDVASILLCYVVLPLFLYGPPTFLMGLSFTMLQRAVHDDRRTTGRKVGILQAGNIAGNVTGSLLVGLVLLGAIGTAGTLRVLLLAGVVFPVLGIGLTRARARFAVATLLLLATVALLPDGERLWMRLHGLAGGTAVIEEDATGVVVVAPESHTDEEWRMSINGKQHSWFPYGGLHTRLGAIAAIVHPDPTEIAIIGLGSGDTAWAAGSRPETERVVVWELCSSQQSVLAGVERLGVTPQLGSFLEDRRYRFLTADGRNALAVSDARFDIIEADALRPGSAFSGNLYSTEFFELCSTRLKPGGILCQWAPTGRVRKTFVNALPYVMEFDGGSVLIGSNEPLAVDLPTWEQTLFSGHVVRYLGQGIVDELWDSLQTARLVRGPGNPQVRVNLDLFPRDELLVPER